MPRGDAVGPLAPRFGDGGCRLYDCIVGWCFVITWEQRQEPKT